MQRALQGGNPKGAAADTWAPRGCCLLLVAAEKVVAGQMMLVEKAGARVLHFILILDSISTLTNHHKPVVGCSRCVPTTARRAKHDA